MSYEYRSRQRVEFADTDMAGIVHFSNYFRYMERAEHEFLRTLGISVHDMVSDPPVSLPRVNATCDYRAPLKYEDELEVRLLKARERGQKPSPSNSTFASAARTKSWRLV